MSTSFMSKWRHPRGSESVRSRTAHPIQICQKLIIPKSNSKLHPTQQAFAHEDLLVLSEKSVDYKGM